MEFTPLEWTALKEDASAITSLATRLSTERFGDNYMHKGTPMEAAFMLWSDRQEAGGMYTKFNNAEEWFRTAWRAKLQSENGSAPKKRRTMPISNMVRNSNGRVVVLHEYRRISLIKDVLPEDDFLADQWECKRSSVSRVRSKLVVEGFGYTKCDGGWRVAKRPSVQPKIAMEKSATETQPELIPSEQELPILLPELAPEQPTDTSVIIGLLREMVRQNAELISQNAEHNDLLHKLYELWV